jgi:steroid delta-isomerase-like uncharacterized protein
LVSDDIVIHTQVPGIAPGREEFHAFMTGFFAAFPEQSVEVHEVLAEGDRVAARHTHHVTHGGEFAGLPPTGRQASVDGLELFRIEHGRIAEMWHHDDLLGLMQQLGAAPAPGHAA